MSAIRYAPNINESFTYVTNELFVVVVLVDIPPPPMLTPGVVCAAFTEPFVIDTTVACFCSEAEDDDVKLPPKIRRDKLNLSRPFFD